MDTQPRRAHRNGERLDDPHAQRGRDEGTRAQHQLDGFDAAGSALDRRLQQPLSNSEVTTADRLKPVPLRQHEKGPLEGAALPVLSRRFDYTVRIWIVQAEPRPMT